MPDNDKLRYNDNDLKPTIREDIVECPESFNEYKVEGLYIKEEPVQILSSPSIKEEHINSETSQISKCIRSVPDVDVKAFVDDKFFTKQHIAVPGGEGCNSKQFYKCILCKRRFGKRQSFKRHLKSHFKEERYICKICCKRFLKVSYLKLHVKYHAKKYKSPESHKICCSCNTCKQSSLKRTASAKRDNLALQHGFPFMEQLYKCGICRSSFNSCFALEVHVEDHKNKQLYECEFCKKCFNHPSNLHLHIRTHTKERPYKCEICNKWFSQRGSLQRHIRIHTNEKSYKCKICEKCFRFRSDLQRHVRIHTNERPYRCQVCEKCFSQPGVLQTHIRTHTNERPFKCATCEKCFSQRGNLQRHIRIHDDMLV